MTLSVAPNWAPEPTNLWTLLDDVERVLHAREPSDVVLPAFDRLVRTFDALVRDCSPRDAERLGARVRAELLPYLRLADNAQRWITKPRGYAGDYLTIARIYASEPQGEGAIGRMVDRCCLDLAAVRAVRHRRALLAAEIRRTVDAAGDIAHVTSLACGPAREMFDAYLALPEPSRLAATLVDFDPHALTHCATERARLAIDAPIELVEANVIERAVRLPPQDLVYCVGLIDYFDDATVIQLLDAIHAVLRPGGRVIVGGFHPRNPTKALMDHVLAWPLVHRDEARMHALFRASAFRSGCTRIQYDGEGVQLFAECAQSSSSAGSAFSAR